MSFQTFSLLAYKNLEQWTGIAQYWYRVDDLAQPYLENGAKIL